MLTTTIATFNEKLLLGNGLAVTPLTDKDSSSSQRSMRDVIYEIDNDTDFHSYMRGHVSKIPSRPSEIKYEQHPTLMPKTQKPTEQRAAPSTFSHVPGQQQPPPLSVNTAGATGASQTGSANSRYSGGTQQPSNFSQQQSSFGQPPSANYQQQPPQPPQNQTQSPTYGSGPPQLSYNPSAGPMRDMFSPGGYGGTAAPPYPTYSSERNTPGGAGSYPPQQTTGSVQAPARQYSQPSSAGAMSPTHHNLPPLRPVFGISLEELFQRDASAVPMVV